MFKINGTQVKEPKQGGITITDEPIWSSNTGRATSGKMIGDIIAWKRTVNVAFPPLSFSEMSAIVTAIKGGGEFFNIQFYDMDASTLKTVKVYCGNIPRLMYSLAQGHQKYIDVAIDFIEQ